MDKAPPLNELAARKRLIQAKMELHRAEMALFVNDIKNPFQRLRSHVEKAAHSPWLWLGVLGGVGFLLFRGRKEPARKTAGWLAPIILPRIRNMIVGWGVKTGLGLVKSALVNRISHESSHQIN